MTRAPNLTTLFIVLTLCLATVWLLAWSARRMEADARLEAANREATRIHAGAVDGPEPVCER